MESANHTRKPAAARRRRSLRRYAVVFGTTLVSLAALVIVAVWLLGGDKNPPRKISEITIVKVLPPPPPPPPRPPPPPEQKMVEQTPVKNEIKEDKPVEVPKEAPKNPPKPDEPPPGPLSLAAKGEGPGDLFNLGGNPGGRGLLGGGGGGGGGGSRWGWYATIVQTQIEAALRANPKTRNAVLQVQVRLWCDGTGRVSRVQLVSSTGDSALDAVLRGEILEGLVLREPPPKDMPMPIVTRITERKTG